jgi:hypothetical protein
MKNILTLFLIFSIISCENNPTLQSVLESNDIEQIKLKRKEIATSQQDFADKLQIIDNKLEELDTNPQLPIVEILTFNPVEFYHFVQVQGSV